MSKRQITLLDGAIGTELRARGVEVRSYKTSLWAALAAQEAPDALIRLHRDYIDAGADVITVNNYAVTPILLAREGMEDAFGSLTVRSAECAIEAREGGGRRVRVAGSLPPLDTTFDPSRVGSFEDNLARYRRITALLDAYVDMYLCETLSTAEEARAAATAAEESGKPFMVSWTIERKGRRLRGGDSFAKAVRALSDLTPDALLVNCTGCSAVTAAMPQLRDLTDLPIGGYANPVRDEPPGGEPELRITDKISPEEYAEIARGWVSDGATIVGGCCDTNPAYIAALRQVLLDNHPQP